MGDDHKRTVVSYQHQGSLAPDRLLNLQGGRFLDVMPKPRRDVDNQRVPHATARRAEQLHRMHHELRSNQDHHAEQCEDYEQLEEGGSARVHGCHACDVIVTTMSSARTIARALGLNEDLTECLALCHDLGHGPFGHSGEDAIRLGEIGIAGDGTDLAIVTYANGFHLSLQAQKLLVDIVLPRLAAWSGSKTYQRLRLYKTVGLPEYEINQRLVALEQEERVTVGYYPVDCEVHVSLTVSGSSAKETDPLFHAAEQGIQEALGEHIYGTDRETLAEVVGNLLREKRLMLSVAESCTGGLLCSQLTAVPGSSEWFAGGAVAYSNHLKEVLLNVDRDLLRNYGAVSGQVARAMAARLAARAGTKIALSITGIAGPGGGTEEKPVGTVYIGLFYQEKVRDTLYHFSGGRKEIQALTAQTALDMIRRALSGSLSG